MSTPALCRLELPPAGFDCGGALSQSGLFRRLSDGAILAKAEVGINYVWQKETSERDGATGVI